MSSRPLPGTFFQIGYVVPDLGAGLAHLNAKLGAPRFMVLREIVVENGWFRGGPATINHSMAFRHSRPNPDRAGTERAIDGRGPTAGARAGAAADRRPAGASRGAVTVAGRRLAGCRQACAFQRDPQSPQ